MTEWDTGATGMKGFSDPVPASLIAFLVVGASLAVRGVGTSDESWFLYVVHRIVGGESLYADVRYGLLPLAVEFTALPVRLLGTEIVVLKAVVAAAVACSAGVGVLSLRTLGRSAGVRRSFVLGVIALGMPGLSNSYNPLAIALVIATFYAALRWLEDGGWLLASLAGSMAGLAFAVKFTVGGAALAAAALVFFSASHQGRGHRVRLVSVVACGVSFVLVVLLIVVLTVDGGTYSPMLDEMLDKREFAASAPLIGFRGFVAQVRSLVAGRAVLDATANLMAYAVMLSPIVAIVANIVGSRSSRRTKSERQVLMPAGFFLIPVAAMVAPKPDPSHVTYVVPLCLLLLFCIWQPPMRATRPWSRPGLVPAALGLLLLAVVAAPFIEIIDSSVVVSQKHFRGAIEDEAEWERLSRQAGIIDARLPVKPRDEAFLVSPRAGFLYLMMDRANPTPFDYPLATQLASRGVAEVGSAIEQGEIHHVCLASWWPPGLRPVQLEDLVRTRMQLVDRLPGCTLYANVPAR